MAKWITASDPRLAQRGYYDNSVGGAYVPSGYEWTQDALGLESWAKIARQLGFQGIIEGQGPQVGFDWEAGMPIYGPGYSEEFANFVAQKKREGYDFVLDADTLDKRTTTLGLRTPSGDVVGQWGAKAAGFGEFFKEFLLPAAGIALGMGGLNSLMGGGAAAAPANALTGAGIGAMEGVGLSGNIINAATGQTIASLPTAAAASAPIFDLGGNAIDPFTSQVLSPASVAPATLPPLTPLTTAARAVTSAAGSNTGIPFLDKAIDFVTSPAGAAIVSGVGNVVGGIAGANAAEKAAETQAAAADRAVQLQREMYEKSLELGKPYYEAGVNALGKLTRGEVLPEPGYAFRLGEGMKALERVQAARGNMLSGGALKAGQRYAQDLASQEYGNAYNRLANIAGLGQTATTQAGTAGQNYASQAGELGLQQANALAQGRVGRASSYGNALLGAAGALQDYVQAPMKEQMFRDIYGRLMGKP